MGNTPDAYNQVWHLPTIKQQLTGNDWIELIAVAMHQKSQYRVIPAWMAGLMGTFVSILKELKEMLYQYDRDYYFDSSKYEARFNYQPTTVEGAVKKMIEAMEQEK